MALRRIQPNPTRSSNRHKHNKTIKMKLEFKQLAPYSPYGLKWSLQEMKTFTMQGITQSTLFTEEGTVLNWNKHPDLPQALFPMFKPLSELSDLVITEFINYRLGMQYDKEIINLFCLEFTHTDERLIDLDMTTLPYKCAEYCFKNGYDFFNLIPQGLAIDINTIKHHAKEN